MVLFRLKPYKTYVLLEINIGRCCTSHMWYQIIHSTNIISVIWYTFSFTISFIDLHVTVCILFFNGRYLLNWNKITKTYYTSKSHQKESAL